MRMLAFADICPTDESAIHNQRAAYVKPNLETPGIGSHNPRPECRAIADQIARERDWTHSLRAESRDQARMKIGQLSRTLAASGC